MLHRGKDASICCSDIDVDREHDEREEVLRPERTKPDLVVSGDATIMSALIKAYVLYAHSQKKNQTARHALAAAL